MSTANLKEVLSVIGVTAEERADALWTLAGVDGATTQDLRKFIELIDATPDDVQLAKTRLAQARRDREHQAS